MCGCVYSSAGDLGGLEVFDLLELAFWADVPVWPLAGTELGSSARAVILHAEPSSGAETCFVVVVVCFYATVPWYIPQRTQAAAPGASRYRMPEEGLDCGWHWVKSYEKRAQHMRNSFFFWDCFFMQIKMSSVAGWLFRRYGLIHAWQALCQESCIPAQACTFRRMRNEYTVHLDGEWMQENLFFFIIYFMYMSTL